MTRTVSQPKALEISTARADELQNWVNRGHLRIEVPNPGRGKSRRYSAQDCVMIAVAVRLVRFGVGIDRAAPILSYVERRLSENKPFRWEEFFSIGYRQLGQQRLGAMVTGDAEGVALDMTEGDLVDLLVAGNAEWFRSIEGILGGPRRRDDSERIIPEAREQLARRGAFAEPFLFFPLGEIVNGTMLVFDELAGGEAE